MKQLVDLPGPLGHWLPIERVYQAYRYYPSPIVPAQPPSLSDVRDRLQDGGRR